MIHQFGPRADGLSFILANLVLQIGSTVLATKMSYLVLLDLRHFILIARSHHSRRRKIQSLCLFLPFEVMPVRRVYGLQSALRLMMSIAVKKMVVAVMVVVMGEVVRRSTVSQNGNGKRVVVVMRSRLELRKRNGLRRFLRRRLRTMFRILEMSTLMDSSMTTWMHPLFYFTPFCCLPTPSFLK